MSCWGIERSDLTRLRISSMRKKKPFFLWFQNKKQVWIETDWSAARSLTNRCQPKFVNMPLRNTRKHSVQGYRFKEGRDGNKALKNLPCLAEVLGDGPWGARSSGSKFSKGGRGGGKSEPASRHPSWNPCTNDKECQEFWRTAKSYRKKECCWEVYSFCCNEIV